MIPISKAISSILCCTNRDRSNLYRHQMTLTIQYHRIQLKTCKTCTKLFSTTTKTYRSNTRVAPCKQLTICGMQWTLLTQAQMHSFNTKSKTLLNHHKLWKPKSAGLNLIRHGRRMLGMHCKRQTMTSLRVKDSRMTQDGWIKQRMQVISKWEPLKSTDELKTVHLVL